LLGVSVTHGCVRVGDEDLKKLFQMVTVGTPVYVF
jgi:lipoprotein-anchoring transpeptidase ErfK/SrfK